jgi:hypothetical protein
LPVAAGRYRSWRRPAGETPGWLDQSRYQTFVLFVSFVPFVFYLGSGTFGTW